MRIGLFLLAIALACVDMAGAQVSQFRLGGDDGLDWEEQTLVKQMFCSISPLRPLAMQLISVILQLQELQVA